MGSFNQTPFLSNITLVSGMPTVLIFMTPNEPEKHAVYAHDQFRPRFLPIYGEYDDYGKIDNVKVDANVKFIESYFGLTIDQIIEYVDDNMVRSQNKDIVSPTNHALLQQLVFTLEHQFYWDKLASLKTILSEEAYVTQYVLEDMFGLQKSSKPNNNDRYKNAYDIPGNDEYMIVSDQRWCQLVDSNGKDVSISTLHPSLKNTYGVYHPANLIKVLELISDFKNPLTPQQMEMSSYEFRYLISHKAYKLAKSELLQELSDQVDSGKHCI